MKLICKRIFLVVLSLLLVLPSFAPFSVIAASTTTYNIGNVGSTIDLDKAAAQSQSA